MTLPIVADCKSYLKVENTAEDALFAQLLARAIALSTRRIGCPIAAESRTMKDRAETQVFYSNGPRSIETPLTPWDVATVVITDADGTVLDPTTLDLDGETGIIRYADGFSQFENGPYTIVADVGLSVLTDYATVIEPLVSAAIIDFVACLNYQRSPAARTESSVGVSRTWTAEGIPCRVAEVLDTIRRPL